MAKKAKIGRNDPCWCGSGSKFKRCHLDRDRQDPLDPWAASKEFNRAFSERKCSVPESMLADCSAQIARAHTVPKSTSLREIAEDNHVYSFDLSFEHLLKNRGLISPVPKGVNVASTFTGFCSKHDTSIFEPVENRDITWSLQQCFLLGYRAVAREVFTKSAAVSNLPLVRQADRGRYKAFQNFHQERASALDLGLNSGLNTIQAHKKKYDQVLLSGDYAGVRAYIIEMEEAPPVMCSGGLYPEQDFAGAELQDVADIVTEPDLITVTSFYTGSSGAFVLSWLEDSDAVNSQFAGTLDALADEELTPAMVRFMFEFFENIHMRPTWWRLLPDETRQALMERRKLSANPFADRPPMVLSDDGIAIEPWRITKRHRIGY